MTLLGTVGGAVAVPLVAAAAAARYVAHSPDWGAVAGGKASAQEAQYSFVANAAQRTAMWFTLILFGMLQLFFGACRPTKREVEWIDGKWTVDYRYKFGVASRRLRWSARALGVMCHFLASAWGTYVVVKASFMEPVDADREPNHFIPLPIPYETPRDPVGGGMELFELSVAFCLWDSLYLAFFELPTAPYAFVSRVLTLAALLPLYFHQPGIATTTTSSSSSSATTMARGAPPLMDGATTSFAATAFLALGSLAALAEAFYEWHRWRAFAAPDKEVSPKEREASARLCSRLVQPMALWSIATRGVGQLTLLLDATHFHGESVSPSADW